LISKVQDCYPALDPDLWAKHGFNQVFFEDVQVPMANLWQKNQGWMVGHNEHDV
jgi:alkylation response protein AidB-like acyl-CoA dehydrogenase